MKKKIKLYAVTSRDLEKAYDSYEEFFPGQEFDAIYIANPHAFYFESVIQALRAEKHV